MNPDLPLVSVITVTYNAKDELEETILSIIDQSYSNIEFLIIDGGSTDGTLEIIEKYKDNIDFFISEADKGIYDAMNKGITHANGTWLNFMNAGDSFASLEILQQLENKLMDSSIDIICGDRYLIHEGKKTLQKPKGTIEFWTNGSPCFHQSMIIRKDTIADQQYNMCYKLSADYEFMVRSVVEKKHFDFVDLPISNFLEGGVSKQQVIRSQIETVKILLDHTNDEKIIQNNIFFQGLINQNKSKVSQALAAKKPSKKVKTNTTEPTLLRKNEAKQTNGKKILIVDPIFRGSRLFYSWLASDAFAQKGYQVDILSRSFAITDQYHEYFDKIPHTLYDGITVSEDFWFGILTKDNVKEMMGKLQYLEDKNHYDCIYFVGLNEQYPNLFDYLNNHQHKDLLTKKILFIEYDIRHLVKDKTYIEFNHLYSSLKTISKSNQYSNKRKQVIFSFLDHYPNTSIGILDERIANTKFSKIIKKRQYKHFFYLPDPSPKIIYETKDIVDDKTRILIVGLQNKRKGLDQLVNYLKTYSQQSNIIFTFVGRLTEETEKYRDFLNANKHLNWHEGYFPEEDIQRFYAESDYVFLPYTPSFTASSGVLAYATSFKKPIISTNHGLIGYKVKHYGLGYTYKYNSIHQLSKIFSTLPTRHTQTYKEKSNNALLHQEKHSIEEHQKILIKALTND